MNNHVIDPTYFYDCIEEFSFDYRLFINLPSESLWDEAYFDASLWDSTLDVDERGYSQVKYVAQTIRGSLQSTGSSRVRSKDGNMTRKEYDFYCKSLYRIKEDDILEYKNNYYICTDVNNDYDEYGVRGARLKLISLTSYRDLADYVKYLKGEKLV